MKKVCIAICVIKLTVFNLYPEPKPKADVHFRVTDNLPTLRTGMAHLYNGILSVTNTGEIAFVVVVDEEWSGETIRFYQEGTEEQELDFENTHGGGWKQRREQERNEVLSDYYFCLEDNKATKTLQSGESITLACKCIFRVALGAPAGVYKAEMYLGHDTWVSVHITPTLGTLYAVEATKDGKSTGHFYYSQEGTNQYLYVRDGEGFRRVAEMRLKSKPVKEGSEDMVVFESPDGKKTKLTSEQARAIARERGQQKH